MEIKRRFRVERPRDELVERLCCDETLLALLPGDTELVESRGDTRTTSTRYTALGREGVATFHFTYLLDGDVRFEKQCDGKVWRELSGVVHLEDRGKRTRVDIKMHGRTKSFVPEFTIKGPMDEQMEQMVEALRERLSAN